MFWIGIATGVAVASVLTALIMGAMTAGKIADLHDENDRLRGGLDAQ